MYILTLFFRQSLSIAELDRMFEDDSTQSFEDLEKRLKTPCKKSQKTPKIKLMQKQKADLEGVKLKFHVSENEAQNVEEIQAHPVQELQAHLIQELQAHPVQELQAHPVQKLSTEIEESDLKSPIKNEISKEMCTPKKITELSEDKSLKNIESPLQKSFSMINLDIQSLEKEESDSKLITLAKSSSLTDLRELEPQSEFLKSAIDALEEHRQEQAEIENQIQNLMARSFQRREQFRAVWGVSPKSINQKRDLKTVIHFQKVKFSGLEEAKPEETKSDGIPETDGLPEIDGIPPNFEENSGNEDIGTDPIINTEIFQQMIEANFPVVNNEANISSTIHNFTGIDIQSDSLINNIDDIFINPLDSVQDVNTDRIDCDLETPDLPPLSTENSENITKSILKPPKPPQNETEMDLEEENLNTMSIFAAARHFRDGNLQEKNKKSVTFLNATPQQKLLTPNESEELEEENSTVTVNVAGFAFNETKMTKNPIVHTPVPKTFSRKNDSVKMTEVEFLASFQKTPALPTPMAMRDISKRAQEALAQLYIDDLNDSRENLKPQTLFNDETEEFH